MNRSKVNDSRLWEIWQKSGAIGTIKTARHRKRMIKAINDARGVEIVRDSESIRFIGHFGLGNKSEMILTLADATNLLNSGLFETSGAYGKVLIEAKMVRAWFKPVQGNDLICLGTRDFVSNLRQILLN
ncbi:MAG: hypothetical protein WC819_04215 [Parcubacteria group bacterium]